jgi:hypothetical protein
VSARGAIWGNLAGVSRVSAYICAISLNLAPAWLFLYYLFIDGGTIGLNKDDIQMTRLDALIGYLKVIASAIIYRELSSRQAIFRVLSSTASS